MAVLAHLAKKEAPFAVIDSHAGRGRYDLALEEARKTGEAGAGIEKLRGLSGPPLLERYLALVAKSGANLYPGSPLIAARHAAAARPSGGHREASGRSGAR